MTFDDARLALLPLALLFAAPGAGPAQAAEAHKVVTPQEITWGAAPASIPAGAEAAVLYGDPAKEGLFSLRLK